MKKLFRFIVIIIVIGVIVTVARNRNNSPSKGSAPQTTAITTEKPKAEATEDNQVIINSKILGKYGKKLIFSKGTENEYSFIGFFLPQGEYLATNMDKKTTVQLSFCSTKTTVDEDTGIEYPESGTNNPIVLKPEKQDHFTLHEGEYVKLSDTDCDVYLLRMD